MFTHSYLFFQNCKFQHPRGGAGGAAPAQRRRVGNEKWWFPSSFWVVLLSSLFPFGPCCFVWFLWLGAAFPSWVVLPSLLAFVWWCRSPVVVLAPPLAPLVLLGMLIVALLWVVLPKRERSRQHHPREGTAAPHLRKNGTLMQLRTGREENAAPPKRREEKVAPSKRREQHENTD